MWKTIHSCALGVSLLIECFFILLSVDFVRGGVEVASLETNMKLAIEMA